MTSDTCHTQNSSATFTRYWNNYMHQYELNKADVKNRFMLTEWKLFHQDICNTKWRFRSALTAEQATTAHSTALHYATLDQPRARWPCSVRGTIQLRKEPGGRHTPRETWSGPSITQITVAATAVLCTTAFTLYHQLVKTYKHNCEIMPYQRWQ